MINLQSLSLTGACILVLFSFSCRKTCNKCKCDLNTAQVVYFEEDFDDSLQVNTQKWKAHAVPGSLEIVPRQDSTGNILKITIGPDDAPLDGDVDKDKERGELLMNPNNFERDYFPGQEVFYRWEVMLDSNYAYDDANSNFQIIGQFHHNYNVDPPPLDLDYSEEDGQPMVSITWREKPTITHRLPKVSFELGVWHEVIMQIKWHTTDEGFFEVWLDGQSITEGSGLDTNGKVYGRNLYNCDGNYLKLGIYRGNGITTTNVLYYDGIRIGNSWEEVTN